MDGIMAKEILKKAIQEDSRKKLVTYFLDFAFNFYEDNWEAAEELFSWITEDDLKSYDTDPAECLVVLLQEPSFVMDLTLLLDLEVGLYKKENGIKEDTIKSGGGRGRPEKFSDSLKGINLKSIDAILLVLREGRFPSTSPEAKKLRRILNKLGHKGGTKA